MSRGGQPRRHVKGETGSQACQGPSEEIESVESARELRDWEPQPWPLELKHEPDVLGGSGLHAQQAWRAIAHGRVCRCTRQCRQGEIASTRLWCHGNIPGHHISTAPMVGFLLPEPGQGRGRGQHLLATA